MSVTDKKFVKSDLKSTPVKRKMADKHGDDSMSTSESDSPIASHSAAQTKNEPISVSLQMICKSLDIIHTKLADLCGNTTALNKSLYDPKHGIENRLAISEDQIDHNTGELTQLREENKQLKADNQLLRKDVNLLIALVTKHSHQLSSHGDKITNLVTRSMSSNLIVSGIPESADENCMNKVKTHISSKLEIDVSTSFERAHRIGSLPKPTTKNPKPSPRLMVVKCNKDEEKQKVLSNSYKLKDKKDATGSSLYISEQYPDAIAEQRREAFSRIKANKKLPDGHPEKREMKVIQNKLHINGSPVKSLVATPTPQELFIRDPDEDKKLDDIKIIQGPPNGEKGSLFYGYAARANNINTVRRAIRKLHCEPNIARADKVMCAFSTEHEGKQVTGHLDDNEPGSGHRIKQHIISKDLKNCVVFVVRYYGGIHLGGKRYNHIQDCAENVINMAFPPGGED